MVSLLCGRSTTTVNSSPPMRAMKPRSPSAWRNRCATSHNTRSPRLWPRVSFTSLKRHRSSISSAIDGCERSGSPARAPGAPATRRDSATTSASRVSPGAAGCGCCARRSRMSRTMAVYSRSALSRTRLREISTGNTSPPSVRASHSLIAPCSAARRAPAPSPASSVMNFAIGSSTRS